MMHQDPVDILVRKLVSWAALFIVVAVFGVGFGCPYYQVWSQEMEGKAELAKADQNRQIQIAEAKAKKEAAVSLAEAEVERAKGVARANQIIGDSLQGNEAYLRYLWIDGLKSDGTQVIYVPTEAGLPILEAGNRPADAVQVPQK